MSYQESVNPISNESNLVTSNPFAAGTDIERVRRDLKTAVMIGNLYREPVVIHYHDHHDQLAVKETLVIATTEQYAIIQGGHSIPHQRIRKVIV